MGGGCDDIRPATGTPALRSHPRSSLRRRLRGLGTPQAAHGWLRGDRDPLRLPWAPHRSPEAAPEGTGPHPAVASGHRRPCTSLRGSPPKAHGSLHPPDPPPPRPFQGCSKGTRLPSGHPRPCTAPPGLRAGTRGGAAAPQPRCRREPGGAAPGGRYLRRRGGRAAPPGHGSAERRAGSLRHRRPPGRPALRARGRPAAAGRG